MFSSGEGRFSFEQKEVSFRRGWALSSEGNYFSCGRKDFPLRGKGVPFVEGKGAEGAGLADDELADEGRRGEDRTKKVDARRDVDPCFLDAPCREELSPLHVQQIQLGSGLGEA